MKDQVYYSFSLADTQKFAVTLAAHLVPKDIVLLRGDLGSGKTTLSRYIIHHITKTDFESIVSPTFNLLNIYGNDPIIYHYDLYRLKTPEEVWELAIEDAFNSAITLIEWPDIIRPIIPRSCIEIDMTMEKNFHVFKVQIN